MRNTLFILSVAALTFVSCAKQQDSCENQSESSSPVDGILLKDFNPLVVDNVPVTYIERAKFDIIDMHAHDYAETDEEIAQWCKTMDEVGVLNTAVMHCSWIGRPFEEYVAAYGPYKDRFRFWCCFDYTDMSEEGIQKACETLERYHEMGAIGVGELGDKGEGDTYARPGDGTGIHIDDPRIKPLIQKAAELKMPISIHIAEPYWMYLPMDETNDGLVNAVTWHVDTTNCLGYNALVQTFENAVRENPNTIFIACHYLNMNHDLGQISKYVYRYRSSRSRVCAHAARDARIPY